MNKSKPIILKFIFIAFVSFYLVSCDSNNAPAHVSIHQLRIQDQDFLGRTVVVKGFLSHTLNDTKGQLVLFATKDDYIMKNLAASVLVKFVRNSDVSVLDACMNHFVSVLGLYKYENIPNTNIYGSLFVSAKVYKLDGIKENEPGC